MNDFQNSCEFGEKKIILHDCRVTHISSEKNKIIFDFKNGFYLLEDQKLFYTDESRVVFYYPKETEEINQLCIYIFTSLDDENKKSLREEISFKEFMELINQKKYEFEFITKYQDENSFFFIGTLFFEEEPYYQECHLEIWTDKIKFYWNTIFRENY